MSPDSRPGRQRIYVRILAARCARALQVIFAPLKMRGRRECRMRAAPAVSCATCTKESAHEHTGQRRQSDIPCAMVLRLMPRSPRRRIRLVTVIGGLKDLRKPGWVRETSADLTPATGARTTRFCRTLQRHSSCAPLIAHRLEARPAITCARNAAASTASHRAFVAIASAPLVG
jgi:hypothetical protein